MIARHTAGSCIGGIEDATDIRNCYATGSASCNGSSVDDFVGYIWDETTTTITNSTSIAPGEARPFVFETDALKQNFEVTLQVGIHAGDSSQISLNTSFDIGSLSSLRGIGGDGDYFTSIDNILSLVSEKQTEYGAVQNRLESALDEISTQYENLVSSRSTLRDTDIAATSSEYIRQQILQQASATLLSTANQTPALALQLL